MRTGFPIAKASMLCVILAVEFLCTLNEVFLEQRSEKCVFPYLLCYFIQGGLTFLLCKALQIVEKV